MIEFDAMEAKPNLSLEKISPYLRYAEIGSIIVSVIGLGQFYSDSSKGQQLIMLGLASLSVIWFLYAFTLATDHRPDADTTPRGLLDVLPTIVRKVVYLGSSVSLIGLTFGLLSLHGSGEMLMIGGSTLVMSCLLSGLLLLRNNASIDLLRGPLLRGLPILVLTSYWLAIHGVSNH